MKLPALFVKVLGVPKRCGTQISLSISQLGTRRTLRGVPTSLWVSQSSLYKLTFCMLPTSFWITTIFSILFALSYSNLSFNSNQTKSKITTPTMSRHSRTITKAVKALEQSEGVGATVRRTIGTPELRNLSPFLMLDHFRIGKGAGFSEHPHRGQATVTYMLTGKTQHEDHKGHCGTLAPGKFKLQRFASVEWRQLTTGVALQAMYSGCKLAEALCIQKCLFTNNLVWILWACSSGLICPRYERIPLFYPSLSTN